MKSILAIDKFKINQKAQISTKSKWKQNYNKSNDKLSNLSLPKADY